MPLFRRAGLVLALVLAPVASSAGAAHAATPFPLGVYVANANGNDPAAEKTFETAFDQFAAVMGTRPKFFNAFTDFGQDPSSWPSSASWGAWSSNNSGPNYLGASGGAIPVVGVPMASNAGGWGNVDQFYQDTIAGKYDAAWTGIVNGWADQGYKTIEFRNGYEFDGNFMPWGPGNSGSPQAGQHFVQAFQHIADIEHKVAAARGVKALVLWNPAGMSWTNRDLRDLYPGDAYVDGITVDQYSPLYPKDTTDWGGDKRSQLSPQAFAASAPARRHFWTWPGANQYQPEPGLGDFSWSLRMTVAFAKQHGKFIAVDETGAGPSGSSVSANDDGEFPVWLAEELASAQAQGVTVDHVNIWCATLGDGDWNFINGSKPLAAAAWARAFGDHGGASTPALAAAPPPAPAPAPATPAATPAASSGGTLTALVGQTLANDSLTLILDGNTDMTEWRKATPSAPIAVTINGHVYQATGVASGTTLQFASPVAKADASVWHATITGVPGKQAAAAAPATGTRTASASAPAASGNAALPPNVPPARVVIAKALSLPPGNAAAADKVLQALNDNHYDVVLRTK